MINYTYLPIPLDSKKYTVTIKRDPDVNSTWNVDLAASGSQVIWLDSAATPTDVGRFSETMITTAERNGSPPREVNTLRQQAVEVYRAIGLDSDASRIEAEMQRRGSALPVSPIVRYLAFKAPEEFSTVLSTREAKKDLGFAGFLGFGPGFGDKADIPSQTEIAHQLELLGDYRNAALLYKGAATAAAPEDTTGRSQLANNAYFALGAAGDPKAAKELREKFSIPASGYVALESLALKDKSGVNLLTYKALSIMHALSRLEVRPNDLALHH